MLYLLFLSIKLAKTQKQGYIHQLSKIKTATKSSLDFFNLPLQKSQDTVVHVVCFSPEKRNLIKEKRQQLPVRFADIGNCPGKEK